MTIEKKIAKNTIIQLIGRGLAVSFALVTLSITTRYLGTDGYGGYVTIIAFLSVFSILVELGLQMISVQSISEKGVDEEKILSNIFTLRFFTSLIALIIVPIVVVFFPYSEAIKWGVIITTIAFFFSSFTTILTGVFQKHLQMAKVAFADIVNKIAILTVTALTAYYGFGLTGILIALIIGNYFQLIVIYYFARKLIKFRWQIDLIVWKKILSKSLPLAITIALNLLYFKGDTVILSVFKSTSDVGLYGAPYRILEVLINLSYLFLGLLLPLMTLYYTSRNWSQLKKIMQMGFDIMMLISLPMVFGCLVVGPALMVFIAGEDFRESGYILQILIFATAAILFAALYGYLIIAANKQRQIIKFYLINAIISLTAYFIFIPKFGYWAAAIITVISELFILASAMYVVNKFYKFKPDLSLTKKAFIAAIIMSVILYLLSNLHVALLLIGGVLIYLLILYLLKGFSKKMILEIINSKK